MNHFLVQSISEGHYERLTIDTILQLTDLVLQSNYFIYDQTKVYRHRKGCPLNSTFTKLLFNIYLQYWQIPLVRTVRLTNQFYGRYYQYGFMTWIGSLDRFNVCLNELNEKHPDIQITTSIGAQVHFLHVSIENRQGTLSTKVYHDSNKQLFLLPYLTGHPRLRYRQWFRFALIRAGLYCSSWHDFNEERLYLELTFLANGYTFEFVQHHLEQFYSTFNSSEKKTILNEWNYPSFRMKLFRYVNAQQQQQQQQVQEGREVNISLYYLYDWGLRASFNQKFYELWSNILEKDPTFKRFNLKIKLQSKHYYSSNTLFTQ